MKAFAFALVLLGASLAHAQADDIDSMCSTAQTQYQNNLLEEIKNDRALLDQATDQDSRDLLEAKLWDLQKQLDDMNAVNCP